MTMFNIRKSLEEFHGLMKCKYIMYVCMYVWIYCTNCTVCNWTVLTVITQNLLLHVQLHNSKEYLLYKYCTNCTVWNWTVHKVITQKLLLHVQLHNTFTVQILYKLYSVQLNCTYSNYTEAPATCSAAQQHTNFPTDVFWSAVLSLD